MKKKCPQCAEQVQAEAKVCRFCRWEFTGSGQGEQAVDDISRDSIEIAPEQPVSLQTKPAKGQPNRFAVVLVVAVILGAGLAIAQFNGSSNVSRPTSTTAAPVRQVLTADQVILPPEEFPLPGYVVAADGKGVGDAWRRTFVKPPANDELAVTILVMNFPGSTPRSDADFAKVICNAELKKAAVSEDLGPTGLGIGESDRVCLLTFADHFETVLLSHVSGYTVEVNVRSGMRSDPQEVIRTARAMGAVAVSVAQRQVEIIRRLTR